MNAPSRSEYSSPGAPPPVEASPVIGSAAIGLGFIGGGAWALWHGWEAKPSSEGESVGTGRWLWCLVGASLVVLGVWVLTRADP
jgi:hypothetical protein